MSRQTRGCRKWTKDMEVYNRKGKFGKVVRSSADYVFVRLYENGELTKKEIKWKCADVKQTQYTIDINEERGLKKRKKKTKMSIRGKTYRVANLKNNRKLQQHVEKHFHNRKQTPTGKEQEEREKAEERAKTHKRYNPKSSSYQDLKF